MARTWEYDEDRPDVWTWIQAWYVQQCNGDWEHGYGIRIDTLDNPGWSVRINLEDTSEEDRVWPERHSVHRSDDDWVEAWVQDKEFNAACGPLNLAEALHIFRARLTE